VGSEKSGRSIRAMMVQLAGGAVPGEHSGQSRPARCSFEPEAGDPGSNWSWTSPALVQTVKRLDARAVDAFRTENTCENTSMQSKMPANRGRPERSLDRVSIDLS
jgi:hypothetical protein